MGLRANFITHFDLPLVFGLLMVAVFAKLSGAASELISAANREPGIHHWFRLDSAGRNGHHPSFPSAGIFLDK
jgi:hypothetical protein